MAEDPPVSPEAQAAWAIVSAAFAALGRAFICVDEQFRVLHASAALDELLGSGAARHVEGRRLEDVLGPELFGSAGALRQTLVSGQRREGWRAHLRLDDLGPRLVSVSAAPFAPQAGCDPRVRHIVVVRPAEEDPAAGLSAPTALGGFLARSPAMVRI